jgi:hypothetical protein
LINEHTSPAGRIARTTFSAPTRSARGRSPSNAKSRLWGLPIRRRRGLTVPRTLRTPRPGRWTG